MYSKKNYTFFKIDWIGIIGLVFHYLTKKLPGIQLRHEQIIDQTIEELNKSTVENLLNTNKFAADNLKMFIVYYF